MLERRLVSARSLMATSRLGAYPLGHAGRSTPTQRRAVPVYRRQAARSLDRDRSEDLGSQLALFTTVDYHALVTDRDGELVEIEADHRRHTVVERPNRFLSTIPAEVDQTAARPWIRA
jgi:hypothetical protein